MIIAALDTEFGFTGRAFNYTTVAPVCAVLRFSDGGQVESCPRLGVPWSVLEPHLKNPDVLVVMHNGVSAEREILESVGLPFPINYWDTLVAERVLHIVNDGDLRKEKSSYSLLDCLKRRGLSVRDSEKKSALQNKIGELKYSESDLPDIVAYCADDCKDTLELALRQIEDFSRLSEKMQRLHTGFLQPHALRVARISSKGILFDVEGYKTILENQVPLLERLQAELKSLGFTGAFKHTQEKLTSPRLNLDVCRTLRNVGLEHVLVGAKEYTKDCDKPPEERRYSLGNVFEEGHKSSSLFMQAVKKYHDLIDLVRRNWLEFVDRDGRIRPKIVFPGTATYRAQQYMPHPLMLPYFARPLFVAKEGYVFIELDFKAQEIGLMADFYGDERLLRIYNESELDLYSDIGAAMGLYPCEPGKPADPKRDPDKRAMVKTALLAMGYGGGSRALRQQLGISRGEALKISKSFWGAFPQLKRGREEYLQFIKGKKVAENCIGLQRGYRVGFKLAGGGMKESSLSYMNYPIQSVGAVILMQVLAELPEWTNPVLTMHDAILLEVPVGMSKEAGDAAEMAMGSAMSKVFPRLRCRVERQVSVRYCKSDPDSLEKFCAGLRIGCSS